jgi:hypothetical protein
MSQIKSCLYLMEYKNGDEDTMNQAMLEACIDNIFDTVSKIVKQYRLLNEPKTIYNMTLFSEDHNISANDYIGHYNNLPINKYGSRILDHFDIEIIQMFN